MSVKKKPVTYEASDGTEFATKREAERYDSLLEAQQTFLSARNQFATCLAETQKTADGVPFDFQQWTYYFVRRYFQWPEVSRVMVSPWDCSLDCQERLELRKRDDKGEVIATYRIDELYSTENAAKAACLEAMREQHEEHRQAIETLAKELGE